MPFVMRRNLFFFLLVVLTHFGAPKREVFAVVVQKWPLKLHSNSSVSLEAGENNTIFFDSDVTTIHNKLTLYVDDDFDFSSEFELAAKALDELEVDVFDAEASQPSPPPPSPPPPSPLPPPSPSPPPEVVLKTFAVACGSFYTCVILYDKSVKCWGSNINGQLGLGDTNNRGDESGEMGENLPTVDLGTGHVATAISAGGAHTCAILDDAFVKCWGFNINGQLGLGDSAYYQGTSGIIRGNRGDESGEMGNNLPAVDLGTGRKATAISAGEAHTCAILDDKSVKCWGYNNYGQLGLGDTNNRGAKSGEMGNNLPAVDLGTGRKATAISAGDAHTCALLDDKSVKCWGYNNYGRLGLGDTNSRGDSSGEMGNNLPAVDLGTGRKATAISAGGAYTCALLDDKSVKCWGYNGLGQLGLGDSNDHGAKSGEMGDNLPAVDLGTGRVATAISTCGAHTCAILDDTSVKCWGYNNNGQLGLGHKNNRGRFSSQMGDNLPTVDI